MKQIHSSGGKYLVIFTAKQASDIINSFVWNPALPGEDYPIRF